MLASWAILQALTLWGVFNYWQHLPKDRQVEAPEGTVAILSVRDDWDGGAELIVRLKAQNAPFRLLIATSGACPAAEALAAREGGWAEVVHAGVAADEGQKIHKLRAALRALRPEDRYIVFIDADIVPPERLIGRLLFPLVRDKADIVSGFRLLLPMRGLVPALVAAAEMQVATFPRMASATMPWGGAMAMRRETAERLDLDAAMAGRLSDDLTIGLAGWGAKMRLRPVRDLLVASPMREDARGAIAFGVRQYRHVATNAPRLWQVAFLFVALQSAGWIWALGYHRSGAILIGYGAAWGRALIRYRILRRVLEPDQLRVARRSLWWDLVAPWSTNWTHVAIQIVAACSSYIRWGGYVYRVKLGRVVSMRRDDQKPAGN